MRIGIVELFEKNHHSMIYNWVAISHINNWEVTLFLSEEVYENVKKEIEPYNFSVVVQDRGLFRFLWKVRGLCKKKSIDTVLFLSITRGFLTFLMFPFCKMNIGLTVHNAGVWFSGNTIRKPAHLIKRLARYKLKWEASYFVVNSEPMRRFIAELGTSRKPVFVLPFSLKKNLSRSRLSTEMVVVYPGSINVRRKQYELFVNLAREFPEDQFVVLGGPSGGEENARVHCTLERIDNIVVYDDFVSMDEFNERMSSASLLFSEVNTNFIYSDMTETYGKTKDSGISYLMQEYTLPCLLNKSFVNIQELSSGSFYFSDFQELKEKYLLLRNHDFREKVRDDMKADLVNFNLEYYSKKMRSIGMVIPQK